MNPTKIEWVKNPVPKDWLKKLALYYLSKYSQGYTINFVVGCSGIGCFVNDLDKCYAPPIAKRFKGTCPVCYKFKPHYHWDRLKALLKIKKSVGVFNSMGEPFDQELPKTDIKKMLDLIRGPYNKHRFYILTKQAHRLIEFKDYPSNLYLGVSVNRSSDLWRIEKLKETDARIKFVSFEPLYEPVGDDFRLEIPGFLSGINQIIIGGETRRGKTTFYPRFSWVKVLTKLAKRDGCKVFLKNNLELDPSETLQEFPE